MRTSRGWAVALTLSLALTACGGGDEDGDGGEDEVAGAIGAADSDCPLPVAFDRFQGWVPERIKDTSAQSEPALDAMLTPGPFHVVCELESPVNVGFLRVYVGPERLASKDPEKVLGGFVKDLDDGIEPIYTSFESDEGLAGTEVAYVEILAGVERAKRRAFLVAGADGVVVVHVGGLDDEEHAGMLPAFDLAKESVRAAG